MGRESWVPLTIGDKFRIIYRIGKQESPRSAVVIYLGKNTRSGLRDWGMPGGPATLSLNKNDILRIENVDQNEMCYYDRVHRRVQK
jgi:hypothetical protein